MLWLAQWASVAMKTSLCVCVWFCDPRQPTVRQSLVLVWMYLKYMLYAVSIFYLKTIILSSYLLYSIKLYFQGPHMGLFVRLPRPLSGPLCFTSKVSLWASLLDFLGPYPGLFYFQGIYLGICFTSKAPIWASLFYFQGPHMGLFVRLPRLLSAPLCLISKAPIWAFVRPPKPLSEPLCFTSKAPIWASLFYFQGSYVGLIPWITTTSSSPKPHIYIFQQNHSKTGIFIYVSPIWDNQ